MGTGKIKPRSAFSLLVILILSLVTVTSALSVTITPERISRGDQVVIAVTGLSDNSTFSLQIQGAFSVTPGADFSFETRDLVMPFSLREGALSATLRNTRTNVLIVQKGDTEVRKVGSSRNGVFTTSETGSIPAGTYELISLGGTAEEGAQSIETSLTLQGKKSGPVDGEITFFVQGISDGTVGVTVTTDGTTTLSRTIIVGNPVTTTQTTSPPGGGGGSSGGSPSPGSAGTTATTTVTTIATTATTPPASVTTAPGGIPAGTVTDTPVSTVPETTTTGKTSPAPTRTASLPVLAALAVCIEAIVIPGKRR